MYYVTYGLIIYGAMHFVNWYRRTYDPFTRIALYNICKNKQIFAHMMHTAAYYSRTAAYFERFSFVLEHFLKASCAKHFLVTKASFLRKWASTLALGIFSISEFNRIRDKAVSIRYISVNFDRKFNRKKSNNSRFLKTKRRERETY